MPEENLWSGTSSQLKNLGPFLFCLLLLPIPFALFLWFAPQLGVASLALLALPVLWAIYRWLKVKTTTYRLTTERLITESGILNKTTDTLELYRVRDLQVHQPFSQRLFGLQTIHLLSADTSTPSVTLDHLPTALALPDKFRAQVEQCRMRKRVRSIDLEDEPAGGDLASG